MTGKHTVVSVIDIVKGFRECGSTLYVGLACAVPSTNTNFRLTFLLTQASGSSL